MIPHHLYSVRMRATASSNHVSGAERLVPHERISDTVRDLVSRATGRAQSPDQVIVTVDSLIGIHISEVRALDLLSWPPADSAACRSAASAVLRDAGVSLQAMRTAFRMLDEGASSAGGNMRGAIIMDAESGARLEPDRDRGVRVSRFDWSDDASRAIDRELSNIGLAHFRTKEALALATKVARAPGIVAELCWSDDAGYTAGYVASPASGYARFTSMKEEGVPLGGRVFFIRHDKDLLDGLMTYLRHDPVLITGIGTCLRRE